MRRAQRLITFLLAAVLLLGLLPAAAFAESGGISFDRASIQLFLTGDKADATLLPNTQARFEVMIHYQAAEAQTYSVSLYDCFQGKEILIGEPKSVTASVSTGANENRNEFYFDWMSGEAGEHIIKAVVRDASGTEQSMEGLTLPVTVVSAPQNYIQIGENYGAEESILYGFMVDGDNVAVSSYRAVRDEKGNYTVNVFLSSDTVRDTEFTLNCGVGPRSTSGVVLEKKITNPVQRVIPFKTIREEGIAIALKDGQANKELYVYSKKTDKVGVTYTFHFEIADVDTSNDPAPEEVTGLQVTTQPTKTVYKTGEMFDRAGMAVTATLSNGTNVPVVGYTIENSQPLALGDTEVTLKYGSVSTKVTGIRVVPDTSLSELTLTNGQMAEGQQYAFWSDTTGQYRAVIRYGEENGIFTFRTAESTEVFVNDEKQLPAGDGLYTVNIPLSNSDAWISEKDETRVRVKVQGTGDYSDVSSEYIFVALGQFYKNMPTSVVDYLCIGSQYTNSQGMNTHYGIEPTRSLRGYYEAGSTSPSVVSLGNFGGYITYYYDEAITDNPNNPYGVDFIIHGNSYDGKNGFAEPGQVWVSEDGETWYALAGSAHYDDMCDWNYSVTYQSDTSWSDSHGNSGSGRTYLFPRKDRYPLYSWPEGDVNALTMSGVFLDRQQGTNEYGNTLPIATAFGYVDCGSCKIQEYADNPYLQTSGRLDGFDLAWAVDADGQPIDVSDKEFHYVKVQTASHIVNSSLGEKSTEVNWMYTVEPESESVGKTTDVTSILVDGTPLSLRSGEYVYTAEVSGGFSVSVDAVENANIYINSRYTDAITFYEMPTHKMVRIIVQEGRKSPVIYYINLVEADSEQETVTITLDADGGYIVPDNMPMIKWDELQQLGYPTKEHTFDLGMENAAFPEPYRQDYDFLGWKLGTKTYTKFDKALFDLALSAEGKQLTLTAAWKQKPSSDTPSTQNITVSFRLIGATLSNGDIDLKDGDYKGAEYVTWIGTKNVTVPEGSTVADVFDKALRAAEIDYENPSGNYVTGITAPGGYELKEMTNGPRSGWMYTVNGEHALNGIGEQVVKSRDKIVFHYVNDYAYEVADWDKLGGTGWPALGDSTYHNAWLKAQDGSSTPSDPSKPTVSGGVVTIKSETAVTDNKATASVTASEVNAALSEANKDKSITAIAIVPEIRGDADTVTVKLPKSSVSSIAGSSALDLIVRSAIAETTIPNEGLAQLARQAGSTVTVSAERQIDGAVKITAAADGNAVDTLSGGLRVAIPAGGGNVLAIVNADGSQTIVKKSVVDGEVYRAVVDGSCTVKVVDNTKTFTDTAGHWGLDAIGFAASHELFQGVSATAFAPDASMTRAMLATVLYRLEGATATGSSIFTDVEAGTWYTEAVIWASAQKIVEGYGDGIFLPNTDISREQLAAMLYRYAKSIGMDVAARGDMSGFSDAAHISDWAGDAMGWAVGSGLIQGKPGGVLDPGGKATRAEVAAVLERMVRLMVK